MADVPDLALETDVYNGELGHAAKHNAVNAQVNQLTEAWNNRAEDDGLLAAITGKVTAPYNVVFDGDSQLAGAFQTAGQRAVDQVAVTLETTTTVFNTAVGGSPLPTMISTAAARVDPLLNEDATRNIVVLWGGTNDLSLGSTSAETIARLQTYHNARRALGWQTVMTTLMPKSDTGLDVAAYETGRQAVNTWIRANWATYADALADIAAVPALGDDNAELNPVFFVGDNSHINNTGATLAAGVFREALATLGIRGTLPAIPPDVWIDAADLVPVGGSPALASAGGELKGLAFDASSPESAEFRTKLWPGSVGLQLSIYWSSAATTGSVFWVISDYSWAVGDVANVTSLKDNYYGATTVHGVSHTIKETVVYTNYNPNSAQVQQLRLLRIADDASNDTAAGDAFVYGIRVRHVYPQSPAS